MTIKHPNDSRLTFDVDYHPAEKKEGEWSYSLGVPPRPAWFEIKAVSFHNGEIDVDVTDFVAEYSEELFQKWEEQLLENE